MKTGEFSFELVMEDLDGAYFEEEVADIEDRNQEYMDLYQEQMMQSEDGPSVAPLSEKEIVAHEARVREFLSFYRTFPNEQPALKVN